MSFTNHNSPEKQRVIDLPHLLPALAAMLALFAIVFLGNQIATTLEDEYVHVLTPLSLHQSFAGTVIQEAALRQPDLLPVFGSSEMQNEACEYRSVDFFSTYPTGFEVFDVVKGGDTSLNLAEDLGALGSELKGKKVVISFTPTMFTSSEVSEQAYDGTFSLMHANALIFNLDLSMPLKHQIARRMLTYPKTLTNPILAFAVRNLAKDNLENQLMYYLVVPLGKLEDLIIRSQDHFAVLSYLIQHPKLNPNVPHSPKPIDWDTMLSQAQAQQKVATSSNPYGIENNTWLQEDMPKFKVHQPGSQDRQFIYSLNNSKEWSDFKIELDVLKELGAKPLIMSRPIDGVLLTAEGISANAQQVYYDRLEDLINTYQMPLVDYKEYTMDRYFSIDRNSHTSRVGWVHVDKTLNDFYLGNLQVIK